MLHRLRTRLGTALLTGPLALSAAVPVALALTGPTDELEHVGLMSTALGPGDGLERYVVTVGRDLPPVSGSGWRQPTESGTPTYDENLAALDRFPDVELVQPLGGNRALLAVQPGTSARTLPFVRSAEPAPTGTWAAVAAPNDPYFSGSWALHNTGRHQLSSAQIAGADVDALTAWEHSAGQGVVVAVIDNGFDSTHPDLATSLWTNPDEDCDPAVDRDRNGLRGDCHGWNFYLGSPDVTNVVNGRSMADHGTPVAGVIAAESDNGVGTAGLAPQTKIMPVVIGGGHELQTVHVAPAIRYAVDNGADIINMSFGVSGDVREIREAIAYAADRGVLMVAAAGNSGGLDRDVTRTWPVSYSVPQLMGVGSSNAADGIATHSDVGATTVHLFAPGQELVAAFPGGRYVLADGTSFASPMTAAAAALVMAARPDMSATAVKEHLVRTVERLPAMAGRSVSGGRLDAGRALATLAAPAQVSVDGLDRLRPKTAGTATVRVTGTGEGLPEGPLTLKVSLAAYKDGEVLAVADHQLDAGTAGVGTTGQDGSLLLHPAGLTAAAVASGVSVPLTTTLPRGTYGLVTQLLTADGAVVTPPQAVAFTIAPQSADDGGAPDGGGESSPGDGEAPTDGGAPNDGETPTEGGAPNDGETPTDGEAPNDGQAPTDGGSPDNGSGDGETPTEGGSPDSGSDDGDSGAGDLPVIDGQPVVDGGGGGGDGGTSPGDGDTPDGGDGDAPGQDGPAEEGPAPECGTLTVPATAHFGITSVTPTCGGLSGGDTVTITGTDLPAEPIVLIGGVGADVRSVGADSFTVSTPRRANTGRFDIEVFDQARTSDVLTGVFNYHDDQEPTPDVPPGEGGSTDGPATDGGDGVGDEDGAGGTDGGDGTSGEDEAGGTDGGDGTSGEDEAGGTDGGDGTSGEDEAGGTDGGDGATGEDGGAPSPSHPVSHPDDFEGLTLVRTGGAVGGLTLEAMTRLSDCGASCFATAV